MGSIIGKVLFTGVGSLFVLFGLGMIKFGWEVMSPVREMEAEELSSIRDLTSGENAEIQGTVKPTEEGTIKTPVYANEAVSFMTEVQERSGSGNNRSWSTYHDEQDEVPFIVEDETGTIRVVPPDDIRPTVDIDWERFGAGADKEEVPKPVRDYLSNIDRANVDAGLDIGPVEMGNRQRCGEGAIEPGDDIHVYGYVDEIDHGWGDTGLVLTREDGGEFVYSTVDVDKVTTKTKLIGFLIIGFGGVWTILTLVGAISPWVF